MRKNKPKVCCRRWFYDDGEVRHSKSCPLFNIDTKTCSKGYPVSKMKKDIPMSRDYQGFDDEGTLTWTETVWYWFSNACKTKSTPTGI